MRVACMCAHTYFISSCTVTCGFASAASFRAAYMSEERSTLVRKRSVPSDSDCPASGPQVIGNEFLLQLPAGHDPHFRQ